MTAYDQRPDVWGTHQPALHACPAHSLADVPPFCSVCLGTGTVTEEQLARWEYEQNLTPPVPPSTATT